MRKVRMAAVCALAVSLVLCGCGQGADAPKEETAAQTGAGEDKAQEAKEAEAGEDAARQMKDADGGMAETSNVTKASEEEPDDGAALSNLAGTTFSVVGDSISTFQGYNPTGYYAFFPDSGEVERAEDTWWQLVADDLELVMYKNGSSSGSTVAGDSTGTEDPQCSCNELRTNDLSGPEGACPDRIVIFMGTNDMLKAVPLGDNDGTRLVEEGEVETFSDAYTLMLDKLQANYPLAEFYCCTLLPVGDYGTKTPYVDFVNGIELTSADYGKTIVRIAQSRELFVIDLYDCGITVDNLQEMTTDGVHPTVEGMRCIAQAVEDALLGNGN